MLYVIFWKTRDYNRVNAIKRYFNIPFMTINKESVADVPPEKEEKFRQGEALGFYEITKRPIPDYYDKNMQAQSHKLENDKTRNH